MTAPRQREPAMSDQPQSAADTPEVSYALADHVATIRFERPERQNTITRPMLAALSRFLVQANQDPEVRAVVVTGSGRFFCAGLDLRGGSGIGDGKFAATLNLRDAPPTVLHAMDKPTLCAHNGSSAYWSSARPCGIGRRPRRAVTSAGAVERPTYASRPMGAVGCCRRRS